MRLREALSVLSKSSPYAVSTERDESISVHLDEVKNYLYIKTDILIKEFLSINVKSINGKYTRHKPLLLIVAINAAFHGYKRIKSYSEWCI